MNRKNSNVMDLPALRMPWMNSSLAKPMSDGIANPPKKKNPREDLANVVK